MYTIFSVIYCHRALYFQSLLRPVTSLAKMASCTPVADMTDDQVKVYYVKKSWTKSLYLALWQFRYFSQDLYYVSEFRILISENISEFS